MTASGKKPIEFRCGLAGVVTKAAPDLLKDGQYRRLSNIVSGQEGSVSSRTGVKEVGQFDSTLPIAYFVRKLVVQPDEDPLNPATNPRYIGILTSTGHRNIYRSTDFNNKTLVASDVDSVAGQHWEMADYSAGASGMPWAYFACPNAMLKDQGASPYATLTKWGIQPAGGVCLASVVTGSVAITEFIASMGTLWGFAVITLASDVALSDNDVIHMTGVSGVTFTTTDGRTDPNDAGGWTVRIGVPNSSSDPTSVANPTKQFRLFDNNGQAVALASGSAYTSGGSVTGVPLPGNLDGGAQSSPNNTQPYDWVMVYEETDTGDLGNPSQFMSDSSVSWLADTGVTYYSRPMAIHNGTVKVAIWGTADSRIGYVRVYRRGGTLTDMIPRLVARVANPGSETHVIIQDNISDTDLVYKDQVETDNDPPVTSTVPSPIRATITAATAMGWQTATLSASVFSGVNPGTLVHILDPVGSEDVYVESATGTTFRAYFQFTHPGGTPIEVDAITSQNCNLAVTVGEDVLVAGDPNNPHTLYKSKTARPQSFPVGTDAAGAITSVNCGTPSNGIVNMTECRGQVLTLNVSAVFEVAIINHSLQSPSRVSGKGLRGQSAWCKTSSEEVWWLSDDGVYSWNGAFEQKRTEPIDTIFHEQQFNNIPPIDMTKAAYCSMAFRRGIVYLTYVDISGHWRTIQCEPLYGDRWEPVSWELQGSVEYPVTAMFCEPDTQSLVISISGTSWSGTGWGSTADGATFGIADTTVEAGGINYTGDWWTGSSSGNPPAWAATGTGNGDPIPWEILLPWFDMGSPAMMKRFEEVWLDIDPQLYHGVFNWDSTITIELLLNFSDTPVDTFTVSIPSGSTSSVGRQLLSLLPNLQNTSGTTYQSYGREARAISFRLYGVAYPVQFALYRILIQHEETGLLSAGSSSEWMDLGGKTDKRVYQMAVTFDTAGTDRQLVLETRGGRDGKTAGTPQVFTLSSPTDLGSGRCMKVIPLADATIGKLFRVRPYSSASIASGSTVASADLWRVLEVTFPEGAVEVYPPDVVSVTPWDDGGYSYLKYANQLVLECNTNGVAVTVKAQADGGDKYSFTVQSTEFDRQRLITLPPNLTGYRWRLVCDPTQTAIASGAGMFQLFRHSFKFQQADLGEVTHTMDWDDRGYPYDKRLYTATIRWDNTGGTAVTFVMDLLSGIGGGTVRASVATFTIPASSGRSEKTFPLPDGCIAKALRIYPQTTPLPTGFKSWKYEIQKEDYPADIVAFTPDEDGGYEYDKFANQLDLEVNTNGVPVTTQVQADGSNVGQPITITTTLLDRRRNITLPTGLVGKKWRLFTDPTQAALVSGGGMFQHFGHAFKFQKADPGEVVHTGDWDDLGHPWDKYLKTVTLEWDGGGQSLTIVMDTLSGINGSTVTPMVASFQLTGGRSQKTFGLAPDTIVKKIRIYPLGNTMPPGWKSWKYTFGDFDRYPADIVLSTPWKDAGTSDDKNPSWFWLDMDTANVPASVGLASEFGTIVSVYHTGQVAARKALYPIPADIYGKMWRLLLNPGSNGKTQLFDWGFARWHPFDEGGGEDPPDVVLWTPWQDFGWPYEKTARNLILTLDTGGVQCSVALQTQEGGTVQRFPVTTTFATRRLVLPCNVNLTGTQWRLLLTPGSNGKAKLWNWNLDAIQEPPSVTSWDSLPQSLGYLGLKFIKEIWVEYLCAQPVTFQVVSDTGTFSITLPSHATRKPERFTLPVAWGNGLNKSTMYDFSYKSDAPCKMYSDCSGVRWIACDATRSADYTRTALSEFMKVA